MRRSVVAQIGWQDNIAVARADTPRAAAKPTVAKADVKPAHGRKAARTAVAKNTARGKKHQARTEVAAAAKKTEKADKAEGPTRTREGRVHQTFAAKHSARDKDDEKSKKG
jgi:hypothetical protein